MKKLVGFILFGNIFISCCTVAMCIETNVLLHILLNSYTFYLFVFGATLFQYNLHYLVKKNVISGSARFHWSQNNRPALHMLIVAGLILMLAGLTGFSLHHLIIIAIPGMITLLYSQPILPFKTKKRIKDYGVLKIFTLALMWTLVTVWLPASHFAGNMFAFGLILTGRFVFIFVLCLMFDIRDKPVDSQENIRTLPVISGVIKCYRIAYGLLGLFLAISLLQFYHSRNLPELNAMLISAITTALMVRLTKNDHSDIFYITCIDGMMLLQSGLVISGSI